MLILPIIGLFLVGTISTSNADELIILGKGHTKIYVSNGTSDRFDFNNDGLTDYYVKAHYTGTTNQVYKVDIKMTDECVDGSTYADAKMKIGFTNLRPPYTWYTGWNVWTSWFKSERSGDLNKQIDLVDVFNPPLNVPVPFPITGDDVIQTRSNDKNGSFSHKTIIAELDNQPGWEDSVFFKAPSGNYLMWTILQADGSEGCETLAGIGIPIFVQQ